MPSPNDAWHQDISAAPVDPNSANIVSLAQNLNGAHLHPDFSTPADGGYGIPYTVVDSTSTPRVKFTPYDVDDSDNTLFPFPDDVPVEGSPGQCWDDSADHHAIVIDKTQCVAYEVYQANLCNGSWTSYGNVIWDFNTTEQRPYGMSSVDAAGLSVFEGLIRYDEIVAGSINHAIRFTAMHTKNNNANGYFTAPAVHAAGNLWGTDNIEGMRIRLKADFDVSEFSTTNQIILNAMKKYGMILADNGANMFFQGTPDPRWNDDDLGKLKGISAKDFDLVKMGPVYDASSAPTGPAPVINSFIASSSTVAPGGTVTLTPNVSGASYQFIDNAGFTRGPITVQPATTTTYTLVTRNAYGTSTASTTVTVSSTGTPSLSFAAIADKVFGVAPFAISASSNSNGAISYTMVSGPATISGNVLSITGVGTVTLKATQAASGSYDAATATTSFNVTGATPTISIAAIPPKVTGTAPFAVSASSNSQGAITYSVLSGPATISGSSVTVTGAGTVTLMASQAANGNFTSGSATTSFSVTPGTVTTNLSISSVATQTFGAGSIVLSANSNSPAAISYVAVSGPATISGSQLSTTGVGTVTVQASQAATQGYTAASSTTSFNVAAAAPAITFASVPAKVTGAAPFAVSASSNSQGPITYSVVSGPATISGTTVTVTGAGTATLMASQAANGNYTSGSATTSFSVTAGTATTNLSISSIPTQTFGGGSIMVSATSNSPSAITYTVVSGPATISGSQLSSTGVGTVTVQASQVATQGYTAATSSTSFHVNAATPSITFASIPAKVTGAAPFAVSASSNSQGAITYSVVSGPATISGNVVTVSAVGTVSLMASQAANGNYTPGTAATSFSVTAATVTTNLSISSIPTQTLGAGPVLLSATSNSPAAISYSVIGGSATISGTQLSLTGEGTVTVQASQAATQGYTAATSTTGFTVNAAPTTPAKLSFYALQSKSGYSLFTVTNSSGAVTFSVVSGPATVSGNSVRFTGYGLVVVQATQAAAGPYSTTTASVTFNIAPPVTQK